MFRWEDKGRSLRRKKEKELFLGVMDWWGAPQSQARQKKNKRAIASSKGKDEVTCDQEGSTQGTLISPETMVSGEKKANHTITGRGSRPSIWEREKRVVTETSKVCLLTNILSRGGHKRVTQKMGFIWR